MIIICRIFNLNDSNFYRKPTSQEVSEMQKYYDSCGSIRKVEENFKWSKFTISKYLILKNREKLGDGILITF